MTTRFRCACLLSLMLASTPASASKWIAIQDSFTTDSINTKIWLTELGNTPILHDVGGRLYLIRTPGLDDIQHIARVSTFTRRESAHTFDIRVTTRMPHMLRPPMADAENMRTGLGFLLNDFNTYMELTVRDTPGGRCATLSYTRGGAPVSRHKPLPDDVGDKIALRIYRASDGRFRFCLKNPDDTAWRRMFTLKTETVTGTPEPAFLTPYLRGWISSAVPCVTVWRVYLDDFSIRYRKTAN